MAFFDGEPPLPGRYSRYGWRSLTRRLDQGQRQVLGFILGAVIGWLFWSALMPDELMVAAFLTSWSAGIGGMSGGSRRVVRLPKGHGPVSGVSRGSHTTTRRKVRLPPGPGESRNRQFRNGAGSR